MLPSPQTHLLARALQSLPEGDPLWTGLSAWLADTRADANDQTTDLTTHREQRPWWAGYERALQDLQNDLRDLRNGDYRKWTSLPPDAPEEEEEKS